MASERLLATSYRYEINKGQKFTKQDAQNARIQEYENEVKELGLLKKKTLDRFRTGWDSNFDALNQQFRLANLNKNDKDDLHILRKAHLLVRRDALKQLLLKEYQLYETELRAKGLVFHQERL